MLAGLFGASSLVHVGRPQVFGSLIPPWLPNPRPVIYASGAAEMICAVGLVTRSGWSRTASVLLLAGLFPGNVQMALKAAHASEGRLTWSELIAFVRLPLQLPLMWLRGRSSRGDDKRARWDAERVRKPSMERPFFGRRADVERTRCTTGPKAWTASGWRATSSIYPSTSTRRTPDLPVRSAAVSDQGIGTPQGTRLADPRPAYAPGTTTA